MNHPTGPYGHPLLGNLKDLRTRVLDFFSELQKKYGDISTIRFSIRKVSYIQHPDYIHHVLQENNRNYTKSLRYEQLKYLLGNGLLTSEAEFWLRQRRMIQPAFYKQKLQLLTEEMVSCTNEMMLNWEKDFQNKSFNFAAEMMALTLQIVGKTLLNADVKSDAKNVGDALSFLLKAVNIRTRTPVLLPMWVPVPTHLKITKAVKTINSVLDKIFETRRRTSSDHNDLLSMLMEARYEDTGEPMGNKQLRDEVMTLFVAGHETTANSLSWTMYLLSRHPEVMQKCVNEINQVLQNRLPAFSNIGELKYLTMVIEESMRLYPPAWIIGRKTIHHDAFGGYKFAPGHNVLISPYALHRDPRYWPDPEKFLPERFLPDEIKKRPRNSYLPFGAGPRMCIGNNFAMMEMQLVISMLLQKFRFTPANNQPVIPEPLITLRPLGGVWLKLQTINNTTDTKPHAVIQNNSNPAFN
ncbi:MAG: cytochrome P450 [Bacteroidota bacterium]|nr:cytochrome P450 [Bacteroidota bacterium]